MFASIGSRPCSFWPYRGSSSLLVSGWRRGIELRASDLLERYSMFTHQSFQASRSYSSLCRRAGILRHGMQFSNALQQLVSIHYISALHIMLLRQTGLVFKRATSVTAKISGLCTSIQRTQTTSATGSA